MQSEINKLRRELEGDTERRCPECGRHPHQQRVTEVDYIIGGPDNEEREPSGWLQQSIQDGRLVHRPYPPDERPVCQTCGERIGVLFLEAMYEEPAQASPDAGIVQQTPSSAIPATAEHPPPVREIVIDEPPEAPPAPSPPPPSPLFGRRWPWEK